MLKLDLQNLGPVDRLVPRCVVIDASGTEIPRYITIELPEADRPRVLARYDGFPVINPGDTVIVQRQAADGEYRVIRSDGSSPMVIDALKWASPWNPGATYSVNNVVEKDGWLMRANKETTDPPDPQLVRTFWFVPDAPSWTTNNVTDGVNTGVRIQVTGAGIFISARARFWAPSQSSSVEYQILIRNNISEQIEVYAVLSGNETDAGWNIVNLGETLTLDQGDDVTIWLHTVDFATTTQFAGDWVMTLSNQDATPPSGGAHRRTNRTYVRFHKTDNASGDRSAELLAVIPGTTITSTTGANWTVVGVSDGGTYVEYDLTVTSDPTAGVGTYTFNVPVPTPVEYVSLASYWTSQPNATLSGHLILDSVGPPGTENDTAYGIDTEIHEYTASPDWDFMAFSSVGSVVAPSPTPVTTLAADRNFILNGDWSIQQDRSITYPLLGVNSDTDILDIWKWRHNGSGAFTLQVQAALTELGGQRFDRIFQALMQTPNGANPDDYAMLTYPVEGYELLKLWNQLDAGANMTLSFWAYFSKTGTFNICIQNRIASWSYIADYTINAADTWEYKQIQIPRRAWIDGFDTDEQVGITVNWVVRSGVNHRAPGTNQWYSNAHFGSPNLNDFTLLNDSMILVGCQLEAGNVATKFENLSPNTHLQKIQRYYETIVPIPSGQFTPITVATVYASTNGNSVIDYIPKRIAPTISLSSPDPTRYQDPASGGLLTPTSTTFSNINLDRSNMSMSGMTNVANGNAVFVFLDSGWIEVNARLL